MNRIIDCVVVTIIILTSCTPSLRLATGEKISSDCKTKNQVHVFSKNSSLPKSYKIISRIHTKGNFFKDYNVDRSMNLIKGGVCSLGGNAAKIIDIIDPSLTGSKSYDIVADVLYLDNEPNFNYSIVDNEATIDNQFCYLKIRRPGRIFGGAESYPLYIGNDYVCSINNNSLVTIQITDWENSKNIHLEFMTKSYPIKINFQKGLINYINCTVQFNGEPNIKISK